MKKALVWILMLALCAGCALAEVEAPTLEQLSGLEWSFSSGVGAWSTDMRIAEDGSFSGEFHDGEMGEADEAYPNGTIYGCSFTGALSILEQVSDYSWKVRIDRLEMDGTPGDESIEEDVRYVTSEPYGITEGDEMLLFVPGTPVDMLTEDMQMWSHIIFEEVKPETLNDWFLYSEANESGFVGYSDEGLEMTNPWVELSREELEQAAGVSFGVPEEAENVIYRYLADEGLAEMQFNMFGDEFCARIKPAALEAGELENISDIYYEWEQEMDVEVEGLYGTLGLAQTGSEDYVELCQWYDLAPGLMYSLSVNTTDPDGLDLVAVAEAVYEPMQGDA